MNTIKPPSGWPFRFNQKLKILDDAGADTGARGFYVGPLVQGEQETGKHIVVISERGNTTLLGCPAIIRARLAAA